MRLANATSVTEATESSLSRLRLWGGTLFFFSGLTGLIYEILWTRRLNLIFGHSILAVSTVVTAYMGGLALGSALGGRWADRQFRHGQQASWFLATYGRLEGLVGVWAFLSLPLLGLVESFYLSMAGQGMQGTSLYLVAFAASLLVLVPPTTAMGATLPVVSCLYHSDSQGIGRNLSRLYSTNTFGAVVGVALAGFMLLPVFGLKLSVALAGLLNLAIAGVSLWVSRGLSGQLEKGHEQEEFSVSSDTGIRALTWGFGLSGALSMAAQMAWTRSLTLTLGSSVYAFSVILVVFLTGIAAGSALFHRWARGRPEFSQLAWISAGIGLSSALAVPVLGRLPLVFVHIFPLVRHHFWQVLLLDLCLCALVLLVPTLLMGVSFPLVTQLYHRSCGRLGRSVGNIYSANTLGCILGSSLTGFVLIPHIGMERTLQLSAAGFLLVAALYAARGGRRSWLLFCLLSPLCSFTPAWDPALVYAGLATHGATLRNADSPLYPHQPAYVKDGLSGAVSILIWQPGGITMRVNGKPECSLALPDRLQQTYLGLVPLLYVQNPKRMGILGLGSGLTLKATAAAPSVESAECAELEPYVIEAERYFAPYNDHVASDPRMKLRYADGRTMIMGDPGKFDCLVSVPSNPWVAGIGNLYTQDFYRAARSKLNVGGVFMQWVNLYALSPKDLQTVVQTFGSVFPDAQLWALGGDLALVGGDGGAAEVHLEGIRRYYEASPYLRNELMDLGLKRPEQLIGNYACSLQFAIQNEAKVPLNTDDNPCLEYSAPFSLYNLESFSANVAWVNAARERFHQLPAGIPPTPEMELEGALGSLAFSAFGRPRALATPPPGWLELTGLYASPTDEKRREWLRLFGDWTEARVWLAQFYRQRADMEAVFECLPARLEQIQDVAERTYWLSLRAWARFSKQDWQAANQDFAAAYQLRPFCDYTSAQAYCLVKMKRWSDAEAMVRRALQENPYDVRSFLVEGLIAEHQGRDDDALNSLRRVCRECPFIQEAWLRSAEILARRGDRSGTRKIIQDYLVFYPEDKQLRNMLKEL